MNRREYLRYTTGISVTAGAVSVSGCLGFFESGRSQSDGPVSDPSDHTNDELSPEVIEATEQLQQAQQEIGSVVRRIEQTMSAFSTLRDITDPGRVSEYESIQNDIQTAETQLETASEGATTGQRTLIRNLHELLNAFHDITRAFSTIETTTEVFTRIEENTRQRNADAVGNDITTFSEHASTVTSLTTDVHEHFSQVSEAALEEAEHLSPGRINNVSVRLSNTAEFLTLTARTLTAVAPAINSISNMSTAVLNGDFPQAHDTTHTVQAELNTAYETVHEVDDVVATAYQQDMQAFQCVISQAHTATTHVQNALTAIENDNDREATQEIMNMYEASSACSYDLFESTYEEIGDEIIDSIAP